MTETFDVNATLGADELVRLTALQMAERLRAGTTTSVELVQAHLDRIAAHDGDVRADADGDRGVRAYLHVNTDEALAVAAEVPGARYGQFEVAASDGGSALVTDTASGQVYEVQLEQRPVSGVVDSCGKPPKESTAWVAASVTPRG